MIPLHYYSFTSSDNWSLSLKGKLGKNIGNFNQKALKLVKNQFQKGSKIDQIRTKLPTPSVRTHQFQPTATV